jgi:hypothetical protein
MPIDFDNVTREGLLQLVTDKDKELAELRKRREDLLASNNQFEQRYRNEKQKRIISEAAMENLFYLFHLAIDRKETIIYDGREYVVVNDSEYRSNLLELSHMQFAVCGVKGKINMWKEAGGLASEAVVLAEGILAYIQDWEKDGSDVNSDNSKV